MISAGTHDQSHSHVRGAAPRSAPTPSFSAGGALSIGQRVHREALRLRAQPVPGGAGRPRRGAGPREVGRRRAAGATRGAMRRPRRLSGCLHRGRCVHSPGKARNGDADRGLAARPPPKRADYRRQGTQVSERRSPGSLVGPREGDRVALAPLPTLDPPRRLARASCRERGAGPRPPGARGPLPGHAPPCLAWIRLTQGGFEQGSAFHPCQTSASLRGSPSLNLCESLSPASLRRNAVPLAGETCRPPDSALLRIWSALNIAWPVLLWV